MHIPAELPIHLLHRRQVATLATHAREPAGFPYPSAVPYATDARHRPVILVSALAEHTRNLDADPRAGFLVADEAPPVAREAANDAAAPAAAVLEAQRMTLLGRFVPAGDDAHLAARYQRYHPDAARYLELGDFGLRVLAVERLRFIGGFGRMGWVESAEFNALPPLPFEEEQALWASYPGDDSEAICLLGVDRFGADWRIAGRLQRTNFGEAARDFAALESALREISTNFELGR
ncbi:pyridoxamine 5'-phosphate oxidase [Burkholderia gladioli]|uniref:HugZ family pyridoxamine 5'-phosphate oxidase n=1 Tax=Burkholderia gladioli TaxID=28095 RepID=UPI00050F86E0|nr:pyridoxamine 5'-phosphate oxidase family protein [Burkholderia gladioli]KGE07251.1 pyridoxamine 5'-phosphate oxidase [Burkholderia gladioli]